MKTKKLFPIREFGALTGVNASTLRAWERRYGLIKPERTPKGHSLFKQEDVHQVNRLKQLISDGHVFANIKKIIDSPEDSRIDSNVEDLWEEPIRKAKTAVSDFSYTRVDSVFNNMSSLYPIEMVSEKFLMPLLDYYSDNQELEAESGFFNKWLKTRLSSRFHHDNSLSNNSKKVIFTSSPQSETNLMLMSNMIIAQDYQALFFGSLLPHKYYQAVIEKSAAKALFIILEQPSKEDIDQLAKTLHEINIPVFVFGKIDKNIENLLEDINVIVLGNNNTIAANIFRQQMRHQYHE